MCWWALADGTGWVLLVVAGGWALTPLALLALGTTRNARVAPWAPVVTTAACAVSEALRTS